MTGDVPIAEWKSRNLRPHRKKVFCVGWSSDGRRLASGSVDTAIKITRVDDGYGIKPESDLRGPSDVVTSLKWHPTHPDKLASIAQLDKNVRFWDVRTQKNTASVLTPAPNLYLTWSADGHYMAVANKDDVVSVIDVRRMKILHKYPNRVQVNDLAWTKDMSLFFQCTGNGELEVFQYPEMKKVRALHGHTSNVYTITIDKQEKYIATGGADAVACLWDMQDFICLRTYIKMDQVIRGLSFSYDSRYLAIAGEQKSLDVENVETGGSLGRLSLAMQADDVAWHPKHYMLAYPGDYGRDNIGEYGSIEFRYLPQ